MSVNHELLDNVLWYIKAHPMQWRQGRWVSTTDCGTAYCFAGHAAVMDGWSKPDFIGVVTRNGDRLHISDAAIVSLRLDDDSAIRLFSASNTLPVLEKCVAILHEKGELSSKDWHEARRTDGSHRKDPLVAAEDAS